ncbi:MAG: hypothetical protein C1943_04740 [Halochromatium sp.]|nr:hypothetical protein [Halochromatium sp.]
MVAGSDPAGRTIFQALTLYFALPEPAPRQVDQGTIKAASFDDTQHLPGMARTVVQPYGFGFARSLLFKHNPA